jgi:hypothetical protein
LFWILVLIQIWILVCFAGVSQFGFHEV